MLHPDPSAPEFSSDAAFAAAAEEQANAMMDFGEDLDDDGKPMKAAAGTQCTNAFCK